MAVISRDSSAPSAVQALVPQGLDAGPWGIPHLLSCGPHQRCAVHGKEGLLQTWRALAVEEPRTRLPPPAQVQQNGTATQVCPALPGQCQSVQMHTPPGDTTGPLASTVSLLCPQQQPQLVQSGDLTATGHFRDRPRAHLTVERQVPLPRDGACSQEHAKPKGDGDALA